MKEKNVYITLWLLLLYTKWHNIVDLNIYNIWKTWFWWCVFYNQLSSKERKQKTDNETSPAAANTNISTQKGLALKNNKVKKYVRTNQKVENGKTTNGTKVESLSHKIQTRKFVAYLHFFMDLLPALGKLSLIF